MTHPDFSDGVYPLHHLTRMYDGIEQLENDLWGVGEEDGGATSTYDGDCLPVGGEGWDDTSEEGMSQGGFSEETGGRDITMGPIEETLTDDNTSVNMRADKDECDENPWTLFKILASTPVDHAFYTSPPAQPSKFFLSRLRKEYTVLNSSLPGKCITIFDKFVIIKSSRHNPCSWIRRSSRLVEVPYYWS